jgi:hypothetical protein
MTGPVVLYSSCPEVIVVAKRQDAHSRSSIEIGIWLMAATIACLASGSPNTASAQDSTFVPYDAGRAAVSDNLDMNHRKSIWVKVQPAAQTLADVYWRIPEYHDEQSFPIPGNLFGPYVYLYASPYIGGFTRASQISEQGPQGTLAAIVYVDASPDVALSQPPYAGLHLRGGINCVWLATNSTGTAWSAFVSQGNTALGCVRVAPGAPLPPSLVVYRFSDPANLRFDDFPAAARFGRAQLSGQPLFGVKCLDGWCEIGPPFEAPAPSPGGPRERRIRGWHDEQVLGVADGFGVVRPSFSATIVPEPNLDRLTEMSFANWTVVARIALTADPATTSKYYRWGLRAGVNVLAIQRLPTGKWRASVTPSTGVGAGTRFIWLKPVTREVHFDAVVPGTARFRWMSGDDGVWVPCGQACCSADAGIY